MEWADVSTLDDVRRIEPQLADALIGKSKDFFMPASANTYWEVGGASPTSLVRSCCARTGPSVGRGISCFASCSRAWRRSDGDRRRTTLRRRPSPPRSGRPPWSSSCLTQIARKAGRLSKRSTWRRPLPTRSLATRHQFASVSTRSWRATLALIDRGRGLPERQGAFSGRPDRCGLAAGLHESIRGSE
jgi:hypothetical protein